MDVAAKKILADLKKKEYAPVYVLQGEETYYIDLIADYIENNVLNESERSFNQIIIYGDDRHKDDKGKDERMDFILRQARDFSLMAGRRGGAVGGARRRGAPPGGGMGRGGKKIWQREEKRQNKQMRNWNAPAPTTILVLCHKYKHIDKRTTLGKNIDLRTQSALFKKPSNWEKEYNEFANEYVKERGHKWEAKAAELLVDHAGDDLHRVANEIEKLILNKKKGDSITLSDVAGKVGVNREFNNFELQRALIKGDAFKMFRIVRYFEASHNYSGIQTAAVLFAFFSKLLIAHSTPDKSRDGLASALNINRFFVGEYHDAMSRFSLARTQLALTLLHETDLQLKGVNSPSASHGQLIKEMLLKIINSGKQLK